MKKLFILCILCIPVISMDRPDALMMELSSSSNGASPLNKAKRAKAFRNKTVGRVAIRLPFKRTFAECDAGMSTDSAAEYYDEWYVNSQDESDLAKNQLLRQKAQLYYQNRPARNAHLQELLNGIRNPEVAIILDNLTTTQTITLIDQLEKPEYKVLPLDQACVTLCGQLGYLGKAKLL